MRKLSIYDIFSNKEDELMNLIIRGYEKFAEINQKIFDRSINNTSKMGQIQEIS